MVAISAGFKLQERQKEKEELEILEKSIDLALFELEKEYSDDDGIIPLEEIKGRILGIFQEKLSAWRELQLQTKKEVLK